MKTKLSEEEKEILDSFEKGEWVPVKNLSKRKKELMRYARNILKKEGEIMAIILKRKNKFYDGSRFGCTTGKVQARNHHDICSNADVVMRRLKSTTVWMGLKLAV